MYYSTTNNLTTISRPHLPKPIVNVRHTASRKRGRSLVHFSLNDNTTTLLANVCPSSSMSETEISSTWYSSTEFECFRSEASPASSPIIQLLVKESKIKSKNIYLHEKEIQHQRRRRKHVAIKAVLEAQRRLQSLAVDKDKTLADVSSQFSNWARVVARRVALMDSFSNTEVDIHSDNRPRKRQCMSVY